MAPYVAESFRRFPLYPSGANTFSGSFLSLVASIDNVAVSLKTLKFVTLNRISIITDMAN